MTDGAAAGPSDHCSAAPLRVHIEAGPVVHLAGELDSSSAPLFARALEPLVACGGIIRTDCSRLSFMDSSGINVLCQATRQLGPDGRIVVVNPSAAVRTVLEIVGLRGLIDQAGDTPHQERTLGRRITADADGPVP